MRIFHNNEAKQLNILDERFYQSNKDSDKYYPSVTTILEVFPKGYGYDEWLRSVGFNSSEILRKAGEQGSNIHAMIDQYLSGATIKWMNEDESMKYTLIEWQMFSRFVEFWTKWKPETYVHEFSLVSDNLGFGGTIDFIGKIGKHIYLIDWKSSNALYKTHELQIAAYAQMWQEINPKHKIDKTAILWLNAGTRGEDKAGKKIQGQGWQLKDDFGRSWEDAYKVFEHVFAVWKEENENFKPRNLIYPTEFSLDNKITLKDLLKDESKKD